jgi:hypothetical protein
MNLAIAFFLLQAGILLSYIPITFLAYRGLREPHKRQQTEWELSLFGDKAKADYEAALAGSVHYSLGQYLVPLTYIFTVMMALYAMTHPAVISLGWWDGLLETIINVFNLPEGGIRADIVTGRFMFWCWLGAYIHAVDRTIRHYLAQDLSPNVYIFAARRFIWAFIVGAIVGLGVGSLGQTAGLGFDQNLLSVYIVCFGIGLFPERGIHWISSTVNRVLNQKEQREQKPLSLIDGIGAWQEGRLDQEGISNVQNLAMANLLALVVKTPFDVGQVVHWVDQAILITEVSPAQLEKFKRVGLETASNVLRAAGSPELCEACKLGEGEMKLIELTLRAHFNLKLIQRFQENAREMGMGTAEPVLVTASVMV